MRTDRRGASEADALGRLAKMVVTNLENGASYVRQENEYGDDGLLACETGYNGSGSMWYYRTYRYDDQGRLVERGRNCEV